MCRAQAHRGPDGSGYWLADGQPLGFGHRRLSIIDLSTGGHQPMATLNGETVISFNGEIYNYQELTNQLKQLGHHFRSHSDTEVVLASIEQWGLKGALSRFVGMFAFALWSETTQSVSLVRDRLGVKPLYYSIQGSQWAFASEMKALRRASFLDFRISRESLSHYMRYGYTPGPESIYEHVQKVPPGSIVTLTLTGKAPEVSTYWSAVDAATRGVQSPLSDDPNVWMEEFSALVDDSVRLRMVADVPVGAFLSGGIDSSTVVALMRRHSNQPIRTYTIGFHEGDFNEAQYAANVARHLGTDHHELFVTEQDLLQGMDDIARTCDEPFSDISILPTMLVSRLAARDLKVVLSGDGGDELFCGYAHYSRVAVAQRLSSALSNPLSRLIGRHLQTFGHGAGKIPRFGGVLAAASHDAVCRAVISRWQLPSQIVLGGSDGTGEEWPNGIAPFPSEVRNFMMARDMRYYLPDDILHKVDRSSMSASLEAREPLLDHRLVEFAWRIPLSLKIRNGVSKWPLRQVLSKHVPSELFDRPKKGFAVPISRWLRGALRDWASEALTSSVTREHFDARRVAQLWDEHLSGRFDRGYYLWDVIAFGKWLNSVDA